jgi:phage-related baseplate assembly protein
MNIVLAYVIDADLWRASMTCAITITLIEASPDARGIRRAMESDEELRFLR